MISANCPYATLMTILGLKLIAPAISHDAKGALRAAIRDDNPVTTFEDRSMWGQSSEVPDDKLVAMRMAEKRLIPWRGKG